LRSASPSEHPNASNFLAKRETKKKETDNTLVYERERERERERWKV
jgi:hypothetical protein